MLDTKAQKYDIIVLAGQSNARGQGLGDVTREWAPDERIYHMTDDANPKFVKIDGGYKLDLKWPAVNSVDVAEERLNADGEKLGCFGFWFAKRYADTYLAPDRKVLLIGANFGGTGFARPEWGVGNIMHTRMTTMIAEALSYNPENRIVAFLWHQGEHDSAENADWDPEKRYRVHKENVRATFADFYKQVENNTIPIVAGGFSNEYYLTNQVACDAVLNAIRECCAEVDGGFVETDDLLSNNQKTGNEDPYHFCRESLRILGERYFDEYVRLISR